MRLRKWLVLSTSSCESMSSAFYKKKKFIISAIHFIGTVLLAVKFIIIKYCEEPGQNIHLIARWVF